MTDYNDSTNHEFDDLPDEAVGNPTKASVINATTENMKFALERMVVGHAQQGGPNVNVSVDSSGFAIMDVYKVFHEGNGSVSGLLLHPDYLPFDTDDNGQMNLYGRRIDADIFFVAVADKDDAEKFLPGGEYDDGFSEASTQNHDIDYVDRWSTRLNFWTGQGQAVYDSGKNHAESEDHKLDTLVMYTKICVWLDTNDHCLYLRFVGHAGDDYYCATSIRLIIGPVTGVYS